MNKKITSAVCFLLGIGLGSLLSFLFLDRESKLPMSVDTEQEMNMNKMSTHTMLEVDKRILPPSVSVDVIKDEKDGYNIYLKTKNYRFTPEKVNSESIQGEGHAHIYVNGIKVARLYGEWFYLPSNELREGENIIEVTLNSNDHSEWVIDGVHISAEAVVIK